MVKTKRILAILLLIIFVAGLFAGCSNAEDKKSFQNMQDFAQAKIGLFTGASFDILAAEYFPEAEKFYFPNLPDMAMNLQQGKIDGILLDTCFFTPLIWESSDFSFVEMDMPATEYAIAFPKNAEGESLKEQIDAFIHAQTENGWLSEMEAKWFASSEPDVALDLSQLSGENGTLRVASTADTRPFDYLKDGQVYGFDVEFLFYFAKEYGYGLEIDVMDFSALLPSLAANRYDLAVSGFTITEERKESVLFSDPYCRSPIVMAVLGNGASEVASDKSHETLADFADAKIGIMTGSSHDGTAKELFPEAERVYFNTVADMVLAAEQGKINGYIEDAPFLAAVRWEGAGVKRLDESIKQVNNGFAFPQSEESRVLREQVNEFISASKADGTMDALIEKWLGDTEPTENPDYTSLSGENGTIRLAVVVENKPAVYLKDGLCTGFEMEFLTRFAQEYGYNFEIEAVPFGSVIAGIATGKYDMAAASLNITSEREESVDFSEPYTAFDVVMVVKGDGTKQADMTLTDLKTAKIGIITGSSHDRTVKEKFPEAERIYFNNTSDMILAVEQEKIDCYIEDAPFVAPLLWEGVPLKCSDEALAQVSNGFVFPQGEGSNALREQINSFLAETKADGTIDRLIQKWQGPTEPTQVPDYASLTGENGTIQIAISVDNKPMLYQCAEGVTGFEMELLTLFAQQAGYAFDIEIVPFESIIAGIASGKYDMGASSLNITPEREESVDFSDPYAMFDVALVTKADVSGDAGGQSKKTLAEFENAKIGVHTGTVFDTYAKERFPNATRSYFNQISDMIVALEQGKIDGYISESTYVTAAIWEGAKIESLTETLDHTQAGYIFQKGDASAQLQEQFNGFIRESKENGTLDKLLEKWLGKTEPTETPDYDALTGENGTLKIAVAPDLKPITYLKNGEPTGYEIELLTMFAKEYGYKLDMEFMTFDAILPGVTTGKYDIGTGAVTITEERAQSLDFSESHLTVDVVMVVNAENDESAIQTGFLRDVKESFTKTFLREDRWKLIVEGIGVTMLISICAIIAGSLLGFGLYMLSRSDAKMIQVLAQGFAKGYSRMIAGTPVVVILMILFYVVFGKIRDMSGIVVAIIGFTLTFGAFVYDHMAVSVSSVDRGQIEAAYALGYTKNRTFFRIIFPQAMSIFLPSYCGQAVEVIKATAVVGYIAVNDLTKMGDIIRSNTYEAFFPLIATAVIYFLLTWLLSILLGFVKLRFEPKRRSKEDILKGVKTV